MSRLRDRLMLALPDVKEAHTKSKATHNAANILSLVAIAKYRQAIWTGMKSIADLSGVEGSNAPFKYVATVEEEDR